MSPTTPPSSLKATSSKGAARPGLTRVGITRTTASTVGGHRLRVTPWQGRSDVALVGPARSRRSPTRAEIARCIEDLERRRVVRAVTPALSPYEAEPFFQAGFRLHEELHLLARYLDDTPPEPRHRLRHSRPWYRRRVLEIDARAFESFWQFDKFSLKEARRATPTSRFVVAREPEGVMGYAVTGRAGGRGYLQRLAVDPVAQGRGIGSSLVNDCLHWLKRKQVGMALVNTQHRNTRALDLYQRLGFIRQREGLLVLQWGSPA